MPPSAFFTQKFTMFTQNCKTVAITTTTPTSIEIVSSYCVPVPIKCCDAVLQGPPLSVTPLSLSLTHALSLITALYCSWILATSCRKPSCCRLASTGAGTSLSSAMKQRARGTSSLCAGSDRATFMLAILTSAFCNIASTCA